MDRSAETTAEREKPMYLSYESVQRTVSRARLFRAVKAALFDGKLKITAEPGEGTATQLFPEAMDFFCAPAEKPELKILAFSVFDSVDLMTPSQRLSLTTDAIERLADSTETYGAYLEYIRILGLEPYLC